MSRYLVNNYDEYYEDEKLYSTGDDDLDDLLERAFCDGYEYAQREFASIKNTKKGLKTLFEGTIEKNDGKCTRGVKLLKLDTSNIKAGKKDALEEIARRAEHLKYKK